MGEEWLKFQELMGEMAHRLTGALADCFKGGLDGAGKPVILRDAGGRVSFAGLVPGRLQEVRPFASCLRFAIRRFSGV